MIRPGPPSITPGSCRGGVVIHVYSATRLPVLLLVRRLGPGDPIETAAWLDGLATEANDVREVCLVGYDGDTGERYTAEAWARLSP